MGACSSLSNSNKLNGCARYKIPGTIADSFCSRVKVDNSVLTTVPRDVFVCVFLPYMTMTDLVKLDSALNCAVWADEIRARVREIVWSEDEVVTIGNMAKEAWFLSRSIYPINLRMFSGMNDDEIRKKTEIAKFARIVSLSYCWMLSPRAVGSFLHACGRVSVLNLSFCTVNFTVLESISQHCPVLRRLILCNSQRLSCQGLCSVLEWCIYLEELDISMSSGLSFIGTLEVMEKSRGLSSLKMSGLKSVHNTTLIRLVRSVPDLTALDVSHCAHAIGGMALLPLSRCRALQYLNIACEHYLGTIDSWVTVLAKGCPELWHLDMSGYTFLGDAGISALAQHCQHLTSLSLDRCLTINSSSLLILAEHCVALTEISCIDCPHITMEEVNEFHRSYARGKTCRVIYGRTNI